MQNDMQIYIGQVVTLQSGGPEMTVSNPSNCNGTVTCVWFPSNTSSTLCCSEFHSATLSLRDGQLACGYRSERFNPGQTVKLRSPVGPLMTVEFVREGSQQKVSCIWFGEDGSPSTALFHPEALVLQDAL
ncbi:DUF2158 domain-containing protein [Aeromonas veronii]|uniref:DUF2158 domain-containing protein n=1 Tax=Aeromonas veronii TaxID=654 RepID=UPI00226CFA38|nr:DUF2158 domain-containing protein [Aeromonas veronii]MCX9112741.1 DUF2158 domain-containing protein [Aeromonas veronii]